MSAGDWSASASSPSPVGRWGRSGSPCGRSTGGCSVTSTAYPTGAPIFVPAATRRRGNRASADRLALLQFGRRLVQQPPGDDELLDLLGALEDVEDLGVARPLLEQRLLAVAQ